MRVVLATYNIHRCIGRDGRCIPERTIEVIRQLDADVIALQEVESPNENGLDFLAHLARSTGLTPVAGPTLFRHSRHYGNAILTRGKVLAVRRYGLAHASREPRGAIDVDIKCDNLQFQIIATHLGLRPRERRMQIRRLLGLFRSGSDTPTALMGDINEWLPWGRPLRWLHSYFGKQYAPPTFPSHFPVFSLDRIWIHPAPALISIQVPRFVAARLASDHLPLRAEVDW